MTKQKTNEKNVSLWHVVGNEDFDIDFNVPFVVFTDEASLMMVYGFDDMADIFDEEGLLDFKTKTLTKDGKDIFRDWFRAYMYVDEDFLDAIKGVSQKELEHVKMPDERPELFVMFEDGFFTFLDLFDFSMNGRILLKYDPVSRKLDNHRSPVRYFANLDHIERTNLKSLFR